MKPNAKQEYNLTLREHQVLNLLVEGFNHREIANTLSISCHTSREYIARIYSKLHVSNRVQCVIKAIKINSENR
ncbi:response regulator transcription factor [Paenibacillus campi]|uniref:response regulator transcription factor n=1 Tax=Paenibacillus campi TaxID=3106031 RepID=UPI002AFFE915|nr:MULTISPECIES: LuxR C-terminal-related transcriptional regulator [unclassified Paenibacillus]